MRGRLAFVALAAFALMAAGASSTFAARGGEQTYIFNARLLPDARHSASVYVDVNGGNKPALRKLVGHDDDQSFAVGSGTQFLRWSHGVPTVVSEANLVADDVVSVQIRPPPDPPLAQIESPQAFRVADRGPTPGHAARPLWLFIGSLNGPA